MSRTQPNSSTLADSRQDPRQRAIAELDRNGIDWREPIEGERFRLPRDFAHHGSPAKSSPARKADEAPSPQSLEERALQLLAKHPDWPLASFAEALGCSIRSLRELPGFMPNHSPCWLPRNAPGRRRGVRRVVDFQSAPDAVEMSREDICNVDFDWEQFCELVGDRWATVDAGSMRYRITD